MWGKKGALTWLGARKDLRIHSDAVEKKKNLYLHHPQERQLQSFHPNYFWGFFLSLHHGYARHYECAVLTVTKRIHFSEANKKRASASVS